MHTRENVQTTPREMLSFRTEAAQSAHAPQYSTFGRVPREPLATRLSASTARMSCKIKTKTKQISALRLGACGCVFQRRSGSCFLNDWEGGARTALAAHGAAPPRPPLTRPGLGCGLPLRHGGRRGVHLRSNHDKVHSCEPVRMLAVDSVVGSVMLANRGCLVSQQG